VIDGIGNRSSSIIDSDDENSSGVFEVFFSEKKIF
jgi:hypothetical protein